jgi:hypothetical protein
MSIVSLADGFFEATVVFGNTPSRSVRYATREEAQELVDAQNVYRLLSSKTTKGQCSDAQILAAADTVANVPGDGNIDAANWSRMIEHHLRSKAKPPKTVPTKATSSKATTAKSASSKATSSKPKP